MLVYQRVPSNNHTWQRNIIEENDPTSMWWKISQLPHVFRKTQFMANKTGQGQIGIFHERLICWHTNVRDLNPFLWIRSVFPCNTLAHSIFFDYRSQRVRSQKKKKSSTVADDLISSYIPTFLYLLSSISN